MRYIFISLLLLSSIVVVAQKKGITSKEVDSINNHVQHRIDSINTLKPDSLGKIYSFSAHEVDWEKLFYVLRRSKALTGDKIEDMIDEIQRNFKPVSIQK